MRTFMHTRRFYYYVPLLLVLLAVFSLLVMSLWNVLMPELFGLTPIVFWQATGLLILCRLLFGMGRSMHPWAHSPWRTHLHDKVSKMTPEERREFFRKHYGAHHANYCSEKYTKEDDTKAQPE